MTAHLLPFLPLLGSHDEKHRRNANDHYLEVPVCLAFIINLVTNSDTGLPINSMYFWLTGILSSFLDNAPTYLVFFNTAGGSAQELMTTFSTTLLAISCGAVFMGAMTYIGNAPNFMVINNSCSNIFYC